MIDSRFSIELINDVATRLASALAFLGDDMRVVFVAPLALIFLYVLLIFYRPSVAGSIFTLLAPAGPAATLRFVAVEKLLGGWVSSSASGACLGFAIFVHFGWLDIWHYPINELRPQCLARLLSRKRTRRGRSQLSIIGLSVCVTKTIIAQLFDLCKVVDYGR
jgi:hypothetical protein